MAHWNPTSYLKFKNERTQPAIDLLARVAASDPQTVIDLGCGPGNSTKLLFERWPRAQITGLDNSPEMLEKARTELPQLNWLQADLSQFQPAQSYDLVFSNAALQWTHDHHTLLPRLFDLVADSGSLAVQVPANQDSAFMRALHSVSASQRWQSFAPGQEESVNYRSASYYYTILSSLTSKIELWETTYFHVLEDHQALIDWYRSTGLTPYLRKLPDDRARKDFESDLLTKCRESYALQPNGKVLFSFLRIFFIAGR